MRCSYSSFMRKSLFRRPLLLANNQELAGLNRKLASNTFKFAFNFMSIYGRIGYVFSSDGHRNSHAVPEKHSHKHPHDSDPVLALRAQLQTFSKRTQQNHPNQPHQVIKQLYSKCQYYIKQNKRIQILILFELICEFIESKDLLERYSTFMIMSANNSFLMGRHKDVERRAKLVLGYQIEKHGEKHKKIADIYNMLGISVSKNGTQRGQEALGYLEKALTIRKQLFGQSGQTAEVLFNMGIIEQECENMLEKAQFNYLGAVQILQDCNIPNPLLYLKTRLRLAETQSKIHGKSQKTIKDFLEIEQLTDKFKNQKKFQKHQQAAADMFLCLLYRNIGRNFFDSGEYAKAIKYFQLCLSYLRQNKMQTEDRIRVLESCAISHAALQQYKKTCTLLQEAQKILQHFPAKQQYKYQFLKYLSQAYLRVRQFDKQRITIQKVLRMIKNTKEQFVTPTELIEIQFTYIYCLGNLNEFDEVILKGEQLLGVIQAQKLLFPKKHSYLDFKSNTIAYVGYAYLSRNQRDKALGYFLNSEQIFSQLPTNSNRFQFHLNLLRKISTIQIQINRNFPLGFQYLHKIRKLILQNLTSSPQKKLNDLIVLLIDYQVSTPQNDQVMVDRLMQAKYIQNINEVLSQIVKLMQDISCTPENKNILTQYFVLIDSIYQMLGSFENLKSSNKKSESIQTTQQLLQRMIQTYDKVFGQQIQEFKTNTFKGDQYLAKIIEKAINVKKQLQLKAQNK